MFFLSFANRNISSSQLNAVLSLFALFFLAGCTVNGNQVSLQGFLNRLAVSYNDIAKLVTAWAYITGAFFGVFAIFQFKVYGESRTMMSIQTNIFKPITYLLVSVALMYFPSTFKTLMMSTFGTPNLSPLNWSGVTSVGVYGYKLAVTPALLGLMRLVGLVSFVRGWIMLVRIADQGQHGTFGKAVTHIVGGLLLINIVGTGKLLWNLASVG
ncbi:MAG: type IV secretion protein IcmC [Gammaproteobacteria bacterium]|nr:type IV secretion protein IcmC [Gammaproteobacteria bacterium]